MANAFLTDLENIGKHILSGIEKAAPVVAKIAQDLGSVPVVGPILSEIGTVILNLEKSQVTLTAAEIEEIITSVVAALQIKTAAATAATTPPATS